MPLCWLLFFLVPVPPSSPFFPVTVTAISVGPTTVAFLIARYGYCPSRLARTSSVPVGDGKNQAV